MSCAKVHITTTSNMYMKKWLMYMPAPVKALGLPLEAPLYKSCAALATTMNPVTNILTQLIQLTQLTKHTLPPLTKHTLLTQLIPLTHLIPHINPTSNNLKDICSVYVKCYKTQ